MGTWRRVWQSATLRVALVVLVSTLALSGCLGGCINIPPISFTITLLNNVTMPDLGPVAGTQIHDVTVTLPQGICNLPTREQIDTTIGAVVPSFLLNLINIKSLTLDRMHATASQGDFSSLTEVALAMKVNESQTISLGVAHSPLGTAFVLEPPQPVDLLDVLLNQVQGGCLNAEFTVDGAVPSGAVQFSVTADMTITIELGM